MDENLKVKDTFLGGVFWNNPTFVLVLGMCPALGVTNTVQGAVATGIATLFVLIFSNLVISLLRKVIPDKVRIPAYIVIISTFVTIVQMVMRKFLPDLYSTIGAFIALIVVNCLVLGRADGFASKNKVWISVVDGCGMGLGFTLGLFLIAFVREFLTAGTFWGLTIIPNAPQISGTAGTVVGFIVLACYIASFKVIMQKLNARKNQKSNNLKLMKTNQIIEVVVDGKVVQIKGKKIAEVLVNGEAVEMRKGMLKLNANATQTTQESATVEKSTVKGEN